MFGPNRLNSIMIAGLRAYLEFSVGVILPGKSSPVDPGDQGQ